jgi:hypothetical protein
MPILGSAHHSRCVVQAPPTRSGSSPRGMTATEQVGSTRLLPKDRCDFQRSPADAHRGRRRPSGIAAGLATCREAQRAGRREPLRPSRSGAVGHLVRPAGEPLRCGGWYLAPGRGADKPHFLNSSKEFRSPSKPTARRRRRNATPHTLKACAHQPRTNAISGADTSLYAGLLGDPAPAIPEVFRDTLQIGPCGPILKPSPCLARAGGPRRGAGAAT